jgi:hypothetical protein
MDRYPLDSPSDKTFLTNRNELEMALTGIYNELYYSADGGYNITIYPIMDVLTDIAWERAEAKLQQIGAGTHDSNNGFASGVWTRAYQAIGRCNYLLTNMEKAKEVVNPDDYNRIRAEAKFHRAYWYMLLTELFGDVPLVLSPQTLAEAMIPRTEKAKIADQLINDLTESEILRKDIPDSERGRISKGAVLALKAKIALYNERWDVAAKAAKDCMDLGVHELDANYEDLFTNAGQKASKEILFALQLDRSFWYHRITSGCNSRMGQGYSSKIPTQALIDSYECTDGLSIDKSPLYNPENPYNNRDPRLKITNLVPGEIWNGYQFETHRDSVKCWNYNTVPPTRVDNQDALNAYASFSGYVWKKYTYMEDAEALSKSTVSFIMLRYAEVLLIYAEAKIKAGQIDQSVYEALNSVRGRVNMPPVTASSADALLKAVYRERKYELALEGHRLFDIRRWKLAEKVMSGPMLGRVQRGLLSNPPTVDDFATPDYDNVANKSEMRLIETKLFNPNRDYLLPVPQIEMETNKSLVQNPNY